MDNERKLKTQLRGGVLLSSTSAGFASGNSGRKPFHILSTKFLDGNEVLVQFSDGTAAIFEVDELEKLRPVPKRMLPCAPPEHPALVPQPVVAAATVAEAEVPLVLGGAIA